MLWAGLMVSIGFLLMLARIEVGQFPTVKLYYISFLFSPFGVFPTLYLFFYSLLVFARAELRERAVWTGIVSIFWATLLGASAISAAFAFMDLPTQGGIAVVVICLLIGLPSVTAQLMSRARICGFPSWCLALAHTVLPLLTLIVIGRSQRYGAAIWPLSFSLYGVLVALQATIPAHRSFVRLTCVLLYAVWLPMVLYLVRAEGVASALFWPVTAITEHVSDAKRNAESVELKRKLKVGEPVRIGDHRFALGGTRHIDGFPMRAGRHYVGFANVDARLPASRFSSELDDPAYEVRLALWVRKIGRCSAPEYIAPQLRLCDGQFELNGLTGIVQLMNGNKRLDETIFPARRMTALVADWVARARVD